MALARLATGRFEGTNAGQDDAATAVTSRASGAATTVMGSNSSRFLGEFNPLLSRPLEPRTMNTGVVLLDELSDALAQLRASEEYQRSHKKKDAVKSYIDEVARFATATRFRK